MNSFVFCQICDEVSPELEYALDKGLELSPELERQESNMSYQITESTTKKELLEIWDTLRDHITTVHKEIQGLPFPWMLFIGNEKDEF